MFAKYYFVRGFSSVVEHSTVKREDAGSNPVAPLWLADRSSSTVRSVLVIDP